MAGHCVGTSRPRVILLRFHVYPGHLGHQAFAKTYWITKMGYLIELHFACGHIEGKVYGHNELTKETLGPEWKKEVVGTASFQTGSNFQIRYMREQCHACVEKEKKNEKQRPCESQKA